mmetsp:Transcript_11823/g.17684  ORF Transcript_11823/g.17684 Transcript_11823/m.17684 type:complete len:783 (+) Transcript_11823:115-2463(+)
MNALASSRRIKLEVRDVCEEMLQTLKNKMSVVDSGNAHGFPYEGVCWLGLKKKNDEIIQWPCWLMARGTEVWEGYHDPDRDEWTRTVCCYGSGWIKVCRMGELTPMNVWYENQNGGRLYRSALKEAKARFELHENAEETANFLSLVSQNLEFCQHPVLLGRIFESHKRYQNNIEAGAMLAVRWNDDDWWPVKVSHVGARVLLQEEAPLTSQKGGAAVEIVYDDEEATEETLVQGSEIWNSDVRCLADNQSPRFDHADVAFLLDTEYALDANNARTEEEEAAENKQKMLSNDKKIKKPEPIYKDESLLGDLPEPAEDEEDGPYRQPKDIIPVDDDLSKPERDHSSSTVTKRRKRQREEMTLAQKLQAAEKRRKMIEEVKSRWTVSKKTLATNHHTATTAIQPSSVAPPPVPPPAVLPKPPIKRSNKSKQKTKQPSFIDLLMNDSSSPASVRTDSNNSSDNIIVTQKNKLSPKESTEDNAVHVAAVDRALEKAQEREARVLQTKLPEALVAPAPAFSTETQLDTETQKNKKRPRIDRLPPGWIAKWSERKGMYYYAHKTRRITRWTPPVAGEEGPEDTVPTFVHRHPQKVLPKTAYENDDVEVPYFTDPPAPIHNSPPVPSAAALDAAKRTIAAYEASMKANDTPFRKSSHDDFCPQQNLFYQNFVAAQTLHNSPPSILPSSLRPPPTAGGRAPYFHPTITAADQFIRKNNVSLNNNQQHHPHQPATITPSVLVPRQQQFFQQQQHRQQQLFFQQQRTGVFQPPTQQALRPSIKGKRKRKKKTR